MAYDGPLPQVVNAGGTGASTITGVLIGHGTTAVTGNAVTQHDILVGGASNAITSVAPSATSGIPVISQGAASDPTFGTAVVAGGGTGATTLTGVLTGNGTSAFTASAITQHDVLVGAASNAITSVAPSATAGVPLISGGSSADPSFGTAVVAGGGTGDTSFTAYAVITGGTTSTGALQSISSVGTVGQILTSNGAGALPTFQSNPAGALTVAIQIFTSTGTYTPTTGMQYCIVECLGAGGAGGGAPATGVATASSGTGGGGGEYSTGVFSASTIGASQSVTIGAGGTGVSGANGNNGGNTSLGALISSNGGSGGVAVAAGGGGATSGSLGGTGGSGGSFRTPGQQGGYSFFNQNIALGFQVGGAGANSQYGAGGQALMSTGNGVIGLGYGSAGSGSSNGTSQTAKTGGNGTAGIIIVTEYI